MSSGLLDAGPFDGPVEPANGTRRAVHRTEDAPPVSTHRLTYLNATWEKVLNDVSKDSGKHLIMSEIPPGQFTRRDFVPHSTRETVQILNQDLERRGFRILEQGDYLIVLNLASVRTRYERSTVAPRTAGVQPVGDRQITTIDPPRQPVRRFTDVTIADTPGRVTTAAGTDRHEATASPIRQTAHDIAAPEVSRESQQVVRRQVTPETSVVEVARYLHESFGNSSRLIESGPGGHPAFQVNQFTGRPGSVPVSFSVGINADENQLIIEGTQGVAENLVKSVGILDRAIQSKQEKIQIVPSTHDVKRLADELGPSMNKLLALHQQDETQTQVQIGPAAPGGTLPGALESPAVANDMRGPVTVQAMPELGVLILTGNKKDVDAVMNVIKEIEKMAVGTTPSIRMHLLQ
ncbi:MAG TPA: hypothetical protein VLA12_18155, partial [Planctomycetaceae bacterium]|nr:hypothetical protein [Planctomycetaceae bacterium]